MTAQGTRKWLHFHQKMKTALLSLCLVSTISAAPLSVFNYLPHYGPGPSGPSTQVYSPGSSGNTVGGKPARSNGFMKYSLPKAPGQSSVEMYIPIDTNQQMPTFHAQAPQAEQKELQKGFMKYSLPKAPGQSSVEMYIPIDIDQMMPNFPHLPPNTNLLNIPQPPHQQPPQKQMPTFQAQAPPAQDPLRQELQKGFMKYSLPKAPGQSSVEMYIPIDIDQMMPNFPHLPPNTNPLNIPQPPHQQPPQQQIPTFQAQAPQAQEPLQQEQQVKASQKMQL
ncbi:secretory calcium-binding phosphoprotein 5 isoform X2 [Denticeps clupeoides]|uniref:secretory calcium-binding phosphoprotein 5 isoform X2 n=1 Tax=Denticeps clupeoides TaxID=299321 RepID=UPI0010A39891|nr:ataxin-2 homolog isoform X2 [Denticeps clupeoides]